MKLMVDQPQKLEVVAKTYFSLTNDNIILGDNVSIAGGVSPYHFTWLKDNQPIGNSLVLSVPKQNPAASSSFTLTVKDTNNCSSTIDNIIVNVIEATAGGLKELLGAKVSTINNLTLTGTIDARDFKTMRDSLPLLTAIDLSGVKIVAYNGTLGTSYSNSYPADAVPERAFQGKTNLTSVILPSSATSISTYAFIYCSGLTLVTLPEGLTTIGASAFQECGKITSFNIPSSVDAIEYGAFGVCSGLINVDAANQMYSSLDGVLYNKTKTQLIQCPVSKTGNFIIPSSVSTLGSSAFMNCTGITGTMTIPPSVNIIEFSVFYGCSGLSSVIIPASVTSIGTSTFSNCTNLSSITTKSSIPINLSSSWDVFYNINKTTCTLYVPFGTSDAYKAADKWKDFSQIVEMAGLFPSPESFVFGMKAGTRYLYLASSAAWTAVSSENWLTIVPASGSGNDSIAFTVTENAADTIRTANVTISAVGFDNQIIHVTQYCAITATAGGLKELLGNRISTITSLILKGNIDARDFKTMRDDMPMLAEIDLSQATIVAYSGSGGTSNFGNTDYPASTIPETAFVAGQMQGKMSLTSIILPLTATSIGNSAFGHCINLNSVILPQGLTFIGESAFSMDFGLTYISIPASVTTIQASAFSMCGNLSLITANPVNPVDLSSSSNVFSGINTSTCVLRVPSGSITAYQAANQWKEFFKIEAIQEFKLSANSANIAASSGSNANVDLTTGLSWTALSGQSWLTVSPVSGTGNQTFTFTAEANPSASIRTATVIFSATGVDSQTLTINQAGMITTQVISLNPGWNIISANVVIANLDLKSVFQSLIDAGKLKKVMDEAGKTIENFGAFGGWKNNIGNLNSAKGYKVNVTAASTLSLEGIAVGLPLDIALAAGWNIISYPCATAQDAKALVQTLIDAGKLKKVMDEAGKTIENFGAFGGWKNNIGNFLPGKGYKVNVTTSCVLTIPAAANKSVSIVPEVLASAHFSKVFIGNGTDHFNVHLVDLASSGLQPGDQIGIFDGKNCVGAATIGLDQLFSGSISIAASFNDGLSGYLNGFTEGHPVTLQLYRYNQTYSLNPAKVSGTEAFEKNGSLFVKISASDFSTKPIEDGSDQVKCYPNPFSDQLTIEIRLAEPKELEVAIYDLAGKLIRSLFNGNAGTSETLVWDGTNGNGVKLGSGTYILKANEMIEKIALKK
jgi:hypothetical protein